MTTTGNTPGIGDVQAAGIPVTGQHRALRLPTGTLGFEARMDVPPPCPVYLPTRVRSARLSR
jgi:hypothetical protein